MLDDPRRELDDGPSGYMPGGVEPGSSPADQLGGNVGGLLGENRPRAKQIAPFAAAAPGPLREYWTYKYGAPTFGRLNLEGVSDVLDNPLMQIMAQKQFGLKDPEDFWEFADPTRNTGEKPAITSTPGRGFMWGYLDPTWLEGYKPPTIYETLTRVFGKHAAQPSGGGGEPDMLPIPWAGQKRSSLTFNPTAERKRSDIDEARPGKRRRGRLWEDY